jgi:hypothetical protein
MRDIDRALQRADLAATDLLLALREAQDSDGTPLECYALVARIEAAAGLKSDLYGLCSAIRDSRP